MPCWTYTTINTSVELQNDRNPDRLLAACDEHGIRLTINGATVTLTDPLNRSASEVKRLVLQSYSQLTVQAGLKKFGGGLRVKKQESTKKRTIKLTVGR